MGANDSKCEDHGAWIQQLDGMFAFALWHPQRKQLILARDEMGIKPLIRSRIGSSLVFQAKSKPVHILSSMAIGRACIDGSSGLGVSIGFDDVVPRRSSGRPGTAEIWSLENGERPFGMLTDFVPRLNPRRL